MSLYIKELEGNIRALSDHLRGLKAQVECVGSRSDKLRLEESFAKRFSWLKFKRIRIWRGGNSL